MSDPVDDEKNPNSKRNKEKIAELEFAAAVESAIKICIEKRNEIIISRAQTAERIEEEKKIKHQHEVANQYLEDAREFQLSEDKKIAAIQRQAEELEKQKRMLAIAIENLVDEIKNLKYQRTVLEEACKLKVNVLIASTVENISSIQFFEKYSDAKAIALALLKPLDQQLEKREISPSEYQNRAGDIAVKAAKLFIHQIPSSNSHNGRHSLADLSDDIAKNIEKSYVKNKGSYEHLAPSIEKDYAALANVDAYLKSREALLDKDKKTRGSGDPIEEKSKSDKSLDASLEKVDAAFEVNDADLKSCEALLAIAKQTLATADSISELIANGAKEETIAPMMETLKQDVLSVTTHAVTDDMQNGMESLLLLLQEEIPVVENPGQKMSSSVDKIDSLHGDEPETLIERVSDMDKVVENPEQKISSTVDIIDSLHGSEPEAQVEKVSDIDKVMENPKQKIGSGADKLDDLLGDKPENPTEIEADSYRPTFRRP